MHVVETSISRFQVILMALVMVVAWGALILQFSLRLAYDQAAGITIFSSLFMYFSYLTIQMNLLAALSTTLPLLISNSQIGSFFRRPSVITGICVLIITGGTVYNLFLRHLWEPEGLRRVADELLHVGTPILFAFYWWKSVPHGSIAWSNLPWWLVYPLAYLAFMITRGLIIGHYPYPILDVNTLGGERVAINAFFILIAFGFTGVCLVLTKNKKVI